MTAPHQPMLQQFEQNRATWLASVKNGDTTAFQGVYMVYRQPFTSWLKNYTNCDTDTAIDIFQDTAVILYENIRQGKLTHFQSSVRNYLFTIGKRIYLRQKSKQKLNIANLDDSFEEVEHLVYTDTENEDLDQKEKMILQLLDKLPQNCQKILYLYYYKGMRMKNIAEQLRYKNNKVVASQKLKCMQSLKKHTFRLFKAHGL